MIEQLLMEPSRENRWRILVFFPKKDNGTSMGHSVNIRFNTATKSIQFVDTNGCETASAYENGEVKVLWKDFMFSEMSNTYLYRYRYGTIEHNVNKKN